MYRKKSRGWYKHKDFILIDLACLFMALILAYLIRNGSVRNLFTLGIYRNVMIFVILVDLFLIILFESYKGVLRRGRYQELRSVIRQMILIELASGLYLFTVSGGHAFSRIILYLMGIFYVLLSYCTRIIWKKRLLHKMAEGGEHSLYIVTNYDLASKVIQNVKEHNYNRYNINGLILIDKDMTGKEIAGVPVVADLNNASSFICQQWVDEVFVNVDETYPYPQELIEELLEMGMPVHVNLAKVRSTPGQKQFVEAIGGYTVLTTTMNYATDRQALAKRVLDILGGLVGCFLTGIIFIFIAPAIYISSPGPIFFSQTRIGKNGKPFKMYKFRSMYMDAEERKAELMAQNKMSDGRMFKLDFDPRVIGNKILPDGTRKTGIGEFIRKTSLDEFPQFWNVLNGSMSLVGTRPILQDELLKYELHHRARIAIKPGITGMWQVSGRSDITDFEEVVRLDTEYLKIEKGDIAIGYIPDGLALQMVIKYCSKKQIIVRFAGMWKDLGTWNTLTEAMDESIIGKGELNDKCSGVHIINEMDVPVLAMGLHDLVISASPEGILVSDKEQSSYIKPFVDKFEQQIMFAEKSWGSFKVVDVETTSLTIKVTLNPGHSMNYHSHKNRDEVWVVISGEGKTIVDGMEQMVKPGDVITMSAGCRHTVIADTELKLIEVQLGADINVHDKQKFELEQ